MIVLDEDHRIISVGLFGNGVGKPLIDRQVLLPVAGTEQGADMCNMTEGPEPLVGKSVVIARFFCFCQPDPPERVFGVVRGNPDPSLFVGGLPVGRSASVGDPRS